MRLSTKALKNEVKPLQIVFPSGELNVEYRPNSYTPADIDRLTALGAEEATGDAGTRIASEVSGMVASWDLLDDDDQPIDPADVADVAAKVPVNVLGRIMREVVRDNRIDPNS